VREYARKARIERLAPHDLGGHAQGFVMPPGANWNRFNFCSGTFPSKRPSAKEEFERQGARVGYAKELRPGGRLVVVLLGLADGGLSGFENIMDQANCVAACLILRNASEWCSALFLGDGAISSIPGPRFNQGSGTQPMYPLAVEWLTLLCPIHEERVNKSYN
jgi:hypothetical protein